MSLSGSPDNFSAVKPVVFLDWFPLPFISRNDNASLPHKGGIKDIPQKHNRYHHAVRLDREVNSIETILSVSKINVPFVLWGDKCYDILKKQTNLKAAHLILLVIKLGIIVFKLHIPWNHFEMS